MSGDKRPESERGGALLKIEPNAIYDLPAIEQAVGVSMDTMRHDISRGWLKASKLGDKYLILGQWVLDWIRLSQTRRRGVQSPPTDLPGYGPPVRVRFGNDWAVVVETAINGHKVRMGIDSLHEKSIVNPAIVTRFSLTPFPSDEDPEEKLVDIDGMTIGSLALDTLTATVKDTGHLVAYSIGLGRVDGLIGTRTLYAYHAVLDLYSQQLYVRSR